MSGKTLTRADLAEAVFQKVGRRKATDFFLPGLTHARWQIMIWLEGKGHIVAAVVAIVTGAAFLLWMMT